MSHFYSLQADHDEERRIDAAMAEAAGADPARPDIIVEHHGSISILRGMTDAGYAWIEEHVSGEGYQPFGLGARLVEPRYVLPILEGALADGLRVG